MSVNLTIAFERHHRRGEPVLCFERHHLNWQDYEAFDRIKAQAVPLLEGVWWYGDVGLQKRHHDMYGDALTWPPTQPKRTS